MPANGRFFNGPYTRTRNATAGITKCPNLRAEIMRGTNLLRPRRFTEIEPTEQWLDDRVSVAVGEKHTRKDCQTQQKTNCQKQIRNLPFQSRNGLWRCPSCSHFNYQMAAQFI